MRKLIVEEWISLDGYATDKQGELDFFTSITPEQNTYSDQHQLKFLEGIDTIILGRKTYELFVQFWPTATTDKEIIADRLNEIPKLVFSNTPRQAPWGKWPAAEVIPGDAAAKIRELKKQPGKDIVLWGSISLAQSLINENLVVEYHLQICPVLTGDGRIFFLEAEALRKLQLVEVKQYGTGVVYLSYRTFSVE